MEPREPRQTMSDPVWRRGPELANMGLVNRLITAFLAIPAPWVVAVVFLMPALETGLVLGALLPGEIVVVLGGVIAGRGGVSLALVIVAGIAGPIVGDVTGYLLGRRYGEDFVRRRLGRRRKGAHHWLSRQQGGFTIFAGRFLPFLRSVLPMTAGAVEVRAATFLPWDIAAACVWGAGSALLGYYAGRDFDRILHGMHALSIIACAVVLSLAATAAVYLRSRKKHAPARVRKPSRSAGSRARTAGRPSATVRGRRARAGTKRRS